MLRRSVHVANIVTTFLACARLVGGALLSLSLSFLCHMMGSFIPPERVFTIAVFNCGYTSPIIQKERGQYSDIFAALLAPAVERLKARLGLQAPRIIVKGFNTVIEEYPANLEEIDAIIVSGSPNSSYEDLPWVLRLDRYISGQFHCCGRRM